MYRPIRVISVAAFALLASTVTAQTIVIPDKPAELPPQLSTIEVQSPRVGPNATASGSPTSTVSQPPFTIPIPQLPSSSQSAYTQGPASPSPTPATTAPAAPQGVLSSAPSSLERVSRPLFEFRGPGMFGPLHYDDSNRWLDFGILVQGEYLNNTPTNGPSTEQVFFRRLRPTIMGGMDDWQAILQMDFGSGVNGTESATTVRWVNFQYTGFEQAHATFGSFKPWFSRELITLGPHLQTIERSPVGNTNYGNPDYMIGVSWDKMLENRKVAYYTSVGLQDHEQGATQMAMRSPANGPTNANQGWLVTGRLDYYPIGEMPYDPRPLHTPAQIAYNRGDFHTDSWKVLVSTAMFGWWNDGDKNPYTTNGVSNSTTNADLNRSVGAEVSSGVRGFGVSADVEYQYIRGNLVDPNFTGGLYVGGVTSLNKFSANGGYMLPRNVELVGAWSVVDATGFQRSLTETTVGMNWFVMKYAVRFSATYSFQCNVNGVPDSNLGVARVSTQFVW